MAEYVWIDAGGETRSKSRVGSLPALFPYLDPGPCFLAMQGNLAGKAPTCPAGPATAYRWDSLSGFARVNHDATAGAFGVWLGGKRDLV